MMIHLRLFALTRDVVGQQNISIHLEEQATVEILRESLVSTYPALKPLQSHLLFASGTRYLEQQEILTDGQELACFPPVSGG